MRRTRPAPAQHPDVHSLHRARTRPPRRNPCRFFWTVWITSLVLLVTASMAGRANARVGDGRVELHWRNVGSLRTGLSTLTRPAAGREGPTVDPAALVWRLLAPYGDRTVQAVPGGSAGDPVQEKDGAYSFRFDALDAGAVRLELVHGAEILASWEFFVRAELTTRVDVDLNLGTLEVDAVHPDPFGNWETWDQSELLILPGIGEAAVDAMDTARQPRDASYLDGWVVQRPARLRPLGVSLDRGLTGVQTPLGLVPAAFSSEGRWIFTRPAPRRAALIGGSVDTGSRGAGSASASWSTRTDALGHVDVSGVLTVRIEDDAGPSGLSSDQLDHNGLDAVETAAQATMEPFGGRLRMAFYARGDSREYYEHVFAENLAHAAREDEAHLLAGAVYDIRAARTDLSFDVHYTRAYLETGDGDAFDVFENYARLDFLPEVSPDGFWWAGDDPNTGIDEGHLRDYYLRTLATDWTMRLDSHTRWGSDQPLRAGVEAHRSTFRSYEHLAPSLAAMNPTSGFQLASFFGYVEDGSAQGSEAQHDEKTPQRIAIYASQRASMGRAAVDVGARFERFDSGQAGVRNREDPLGADERLGDDDRTGDPSVTYVQPRVGVYSPLGERTHLWIDGGRTDAIPPYEALYFDEAFYERQAGVAADSQVRAARGFIFGNPELKPETRWAAQVGVVRRLGENATLRISGSLSTTTDTWVAVQESAGFDSLAYYDNDGTRREQTLHLGLTWQTGTRTRLRASYDLGRTETNVVEPFSLLRGLRYPSLALENSALPQTAVSDLSGFHDGRDRDFYPSLLDRRHQLAVSWTLQFANARTSTLGDRTGGAAVLTFRAGSGLPYTQTFVRKAGDVLEQTTTPRPIDDASRNEARMPATWQIDLAIGHPFEYFGQQFVGWLEGRNLTDHQNVVRVYTATGDAEDDGWLESSEGEAAILTGGPDFANRYRDRLQDPTHFAEGLAVRAGLSILF